jgi:hypothetical protein
MVDMWMLSVAAALIDHVAESDPPALARLEQAVRTVPGLGNSLDAARSGDAADRIRLAEALADGLKAQYDEGGTFAVLLDTLWPEVLFGPQKSRGGNFIRGNVVGNVVQAKHIVGGLTLTTPDRSPVEEPVERRPRFGFGRRDQ